MAKAEQQDRPRISIDVVNRTVSWEGVEPVPFPISDRHRQMFLEGVDVIGLSLSYRGEISQFAERHWSAQPWLRDVAQRMKGRLPAS
jgi:3-isopropylmalate/(R)-2-methylmalate dehydratase small subunit